jgi:hypothetical protein
MSAAALHISASQVGGGGGSGSKGGASSLLPSGSALGRRRAGSPAYGSVVADWCTLGIDRMNRTAVTMGIVACIVAALWGAALYIFDQTSEQRGRAPSATERLLARAPAPSTLEAEPPAHEEHPVQQAQQAQQVHEEDGKDDPSAWRETWSTERDNPSWNKQVTRELTQMAESLAYGEVVLSDLSCRQTVCRMQLQFADELDARLFMEAPHDPKLRQAYQSVDGAKSAHTYELLIKRPSPDYSPEPGTPGGIRPAGGRLRVLPVVPTQ